jgi:hypothetical protein
LKFWGIMTLLFASSLVQGSNNAFDNKLAVDSIVKCTARDQQLSLPTVVKYQMATFKAALNRSITLQILDNRGKSTKHCAQNSYMPLNKYIEELGLKEKFQSLSHSINNIFPSIELDALSNKTFICKSRIRLERLIGPGVNYASKRNLVWIKGDAHSFDGIFYEAQPNVSTNKNKDILTWAFVKELLHNKVNLDKEFYARDGDLQEVVSLIKSHLLSESQDPNQLIEKTTTLNFPFD